MDSPSPTPIKEIFDVSPGQFLVTDQNSVVLYANREIERKTGYSMAEAVGKRPGDLWGGRMPRAYYKKMWHTIQTHRTFFLNEATNSTKQGENFSDKTYIVPILSDSSVSNFVAFTPLLQNDTEKEALENDLEQILSTQTTNGFLALQKIYFWLARKQIDLPAIEKIPLSRLFCDQLITPTTKMFQERMTDKALILEAQKNTKNFDALYIKYHKKIFAYFLSHLKDTIVAEDLTQETFIKALGHLQNFVPSNASYQTYLFRIAHNILVNQYRKTFTASPLDPQTNKLHSAPRSLDLYSLEEGVQRLSSEEQDLLHLVYQQGYSLQEVASQKGKTENAIKLKISRVRKRLRQFLGV